MRQDNHWFDAIVTSARDVTQHVREIEITPEGGAPHFVVGSHINVSITVDGREDTRSYSLIGEPDGGRYRIAVKAHADSRGGSLYMRSLQKGTRLTVSAPVSGFELDLGASEYLLVAGGIGVTPLIGMASTLKRLGKPFRFLYAGRSRCDMAYLDDLSALLGERLHAFPKDQTKTLNLASEIASLAADGEVYLCGPARLLDDARRIWAETGRPLTKLRYETFGSGGHLATKAFTVEVPRLGLTVEVPENVSMLDALENAGVAVLYDCKRGECGLCALDVLGADSAIDHRDVFFSERQRAENNKICACVSRAAGGKIIIDTAYRN